MIIFVAVSTAATITQRNEIDSMNTIFTLDNVLLYSNNNRTKFLCITFYSIAIIASAF